MDSATSKSLHRKAAHCVTLCVKLPLWRDKFCRHRQGLKKSADMKFISKKTMTFLTKMMTHSVGYSILDLMNGLILTLPLTVTNLKSKI